MKIWLAYKFREVDLKILRSQLEEITKTLQASGHEVVTMIRDIQDWDPTKMSKAEAVKRAYTLCQQCDMALCIYPTGDPSEGRGWDAGYFAGMGKPTVMAIHKSLAIPFTEALFSENPANKKQNLPSVIRYQSFQDIADLLG